MKLWFCLGIFLPFIGLAQTTELEMTTTSADEQMAFVEPSIANNDSLNIIYVDRDPEMDALIEYYKKEDPPILKWNIPKFRLFNPRPRFSYYTINDIRITRSGVEQYLGEVAPMAYKDYSAGRQLRRKSLKWLYVGLGGYLLVLSTQQKGIRTFGWGAAIVGGSFSLGHLFAGNRRERRGINRYNTEFR